MKSDACDNERVPAEAAAYCQLVTRSAGQSKETRALAYAMCLQGVTRTLEGICRRGPRSP